MNKVPSIVKALGQTEMVIPPILDNKNTSSPSVFVPLALLREARRQKNIPAVQVPPVCLLDPDGDLERALRGSGRAKRFAGWPCYHTELDTCTIARQEVGIVGRVVGASFAVLLAEELSPSDQFDIRGPDRSGRAASLLRYHRPRVARRRHKLSLHASF